MPRNTHLSILGVNSHIHYEASAILYEQPFSFVGSIRAAIAFLRDRSVASSARVPAKLSIVTRLKVTFRIHDVERRVPMYGALTTKIAANMRDWRLLHNILDHPCSSLREYHLVLGADVWEVAPWRQHAPKSLFNMAGLLEISSATNLREPHESEVHPLRQLRDRNFLQHVARLNPRVQLAIDAPLYYPEGRLRAYAAKLCSTMLEDILQRPTQLRKRQSTCASREVEDCCFHRSPEGVPRCSQTPHVPTLRSQVPQATWY